MTGIMHRAIGREIVMIRSKSRRLRKLRGNLTWVGYSKFNLLKPRLNKFLDLQVSPVVDYFKNINAFLLYPICFRITFHNKGVYFR